METSGYYPESIPMPRTAVGGCVCACGGGGGVRVVMNQDLCVYPTPQSG